MLFRKSDVYVLMIRFHRFTVPGSEDLIVPARSTVMPGCTQKIASAKGFIEFWRIRSSAAALAKILGDAFGTVLAENAYADDKKNKLLRAVEEKKLKLETGWYDVDIGLCMGFETKPGTSYVVSNST
jgi:hypothetical protein